MIKQLKIIIVFASIELSSTHAADLSKKNSKVLSDWAFKNQKSLLIGNSVRFVRVKLAEGFTNAKVSGSDIKDRDTVYFDSKSGLFYFDVDTLTPYADGSRVSLMTHRTYGILKADGAVNILTKKAIFTATYIVKTK